MSKPLDILDRGKDYQAIYDETFRTELGLRAISFMYDDHSDDKNSYDNILKLKDNIRYRLFSAVHQYLVFLRELGGSEKYLGDIQKKDPHYLNSFVMGNPFYEKVEQELSSVFDNIVFQISSVFDYMSHIICYMMFRNKTNTLYWTKLAKAARGTNNELSPLEIAKVIDGIDRQFVGRLYDYRSRLLHNRRDEHRFGYDMTVPSFDIRVKILPSEAALKHFNLIEADTQGSNVTLTYLSSWLIKRTFIEIEKMLDALENELKTNSHFHKNLRTRKRADGFMLASHNPNTRMLEPVSEGLWKQYKEKK